MKVVVIIIIVAMAGGLLWAGGSALFGGGRNSQTTQAAAVVATVNGQGISQYDLHQTFINRLQQIEQEQGILPGSAYEEVRFGALESLIGSVVISQEIAERKLTATKAEIAEELQIIIDQFPTKEDYKLQLQMVGLTEDLLKARLEEEIKFDKLKREVSGEHPVSEQEIIEAYERVRASHILIIPENNSDEAWAEAESKAWEIHADTTVENFAEMAELHSEDSSSVEGGDVGFIARGQTVVEFEETIFDLDIDAISEPVRSQFGYHIITVTERQEAAGEEFEEVRDLIEDLIRNEKGQGDLLAWFEQAKAEAEVIYTDFQMSAFAQMQEENYEDAIHYYKLAIEQQPNDGYLHASLGNAYIQLEDLDAALEQYEEATKIFASDHSLFMTLGELYEENNQIDEAVQAYLKASELVPNDIFAQLTLYSHLSRLERYEDALEIEDRIAAFQELQNERLKAQEALQAPELTETDAMEDDLVELLDEEEVDLPAEESAPEN